MKRVNQAFFNQLRSSATDLAKCWRIERSDGVVIGFTEHDKVLTIDGVDYSPTNAFSSSAFSQKSDLSVSNINVVALISDLITEDDLHAGKFDNADVKIFYVIWSQLQYGTMPVMGARFGEVKFMEGQFEVELRSRAQALQQPIGRVYGLECDALLGDSRCTVDVADYTQTGTVAALFDVIGFYDNALTAEEDGYFQYGVVTFTTGDNEGLSMEVRGHAGNLVVLLEPPAFPISIGDEYEIVAGCDKTCDTCRLKFANLDNFRGFPHMPTEQEATETPDARLE